MKLIRVNGLFSTGAIKPRRSVFSMTRKTRSVSSARSFDYVYLSGITLAILTDVSRDRLLAWLPKYREAGGKVIFDNNV